MLAPTGVVPPGETPGRCGALTKDLEQARCSLSLLGSQQLSSLLWESSPWEPHSQVSAVRGGTNTHTRTQMLRAHNRAQVSHQLTWPSPEPTSLNTRSPARPPAPALPAVSVLSTCLAHHPTPRLTLKDPGPGLEVGKAR